MESRENKLWRLNTKRFRAGNWKPKYSQNNRHFKSKPVGVDDFLSFYAGTQVSKFNGFQKNHFVTKGRVQRVANNNSNVTQN